MKRFIILMATVLLPFWALAQRDDSPEIQKRS